MSISGARPIGLAIAAIVGAAPALAAAGPMAKDADATIPRPHQPPLVVPADDTQTHARASRTVLRLDDTYEWLGAWGSEPNRLAWWLDLGIGPFLGRIPLRRASLGALERWSGRIRFGTLAPSDDLGPLTLAVRWHTIPDLFDRAPMLHVQHGVEVAVSTPWLGAADRVPDDVLVHLHGPDSELADNGWSLRPVDWHFRADVMICRSWHAEVGAGPELFRSTAQPDRPLDYALRWHANVGVGLACATRNDRWIDDVTVAAQYRARGVLHNREDGMSYRQTGSLALQYAPAGGFAVSLYAAVDPSAFTDYLMLGLRLQLTAGGPR